MTDSNPTVARALRRWIAVEHFRYARRLPRFNFLECDFLKHNLDERVLEPR